MHFVSLSQTGILGGDLQPVVHRPDLIMEPGVSVVFDSGSLHPHCSWEVGGFTIAQW